MHGHPFGKVTFTEQRNLSVNRYGPPYTTWFEQDLQWLSQALEKRTTTFCCLIKSGGGRCKVSGEKRCVGQFRGVAVPGGGDEVDICGWVGVLWRVGRNCCGSPQQFDCLFLSP